MALAIQVCSYVLWLPLKLLGIQAMLHAGVRRYPLIFAYSVVTFLLTVLQAPLSLSYYRTDRGLKWFERIHYASQGLTYVLILAVVLELLYRASAGIGGRRVLRLGLLAGGSAFAALSGFVHYDQSIQLGEWMTPWTRDLNFCAAIIDLALWGILIRSRRPDRDTLLLLTGGMGIMFAGEAIGAAVRDIGVQRVSYPVFLTGHAIVVLADAAFLFVWWQAFRKIAAGRPTAIPAAKARA